MEFASLNTKLIMTMVVEIIFAVIFISKWTNSTPNLKPLKQSKPVSLDAPPHDQHCWAWFVDINDGWPDSGNLIANDSIDLEEAMIPY